MDSVDPICAINYSMPLDSIPSYRRMKRDSTAASVAGKPCMLRLAARCTAYFLNVKCYFIEVKSRSVQKQLCATCAMPDASRLAWLRAARFIYTSGISEGTGRHHMSPRQAPPPVANPTNHE